jgi:hypothetical protein
MYETLFRIAGFAVPVWLLLIFLPRWRVSAWLARSMAAPVFLAALYAWGLFAFVADNGAGFMRDFGTVEGVTALLTNPAVAIVAWIHILAFDHAVGIMIYRENMERRYVSLPVQSVILFFTFMLGPVGFLSYWLVRAQRRREAKRPLTAGADTRGAESAPVRPTSGFGTIGALVELLKVRFGREPLLTGLGVLGLVLGAALVVLHVVRGGEPIPPEGDLTKPISFNIAVGLYLLTLVLWLPAAGFGRTGRAVWLGTTLVASLYAYGIETIQAVRGLDPRFSAVAGVRDQILGGGFFFSALVLIVLFLAIAWRIFRPDRADARAPLLLALRYASGAVMLAFVAGLWMSAINGRITGEAGNLLPLHALGFHGLQAVPVIALLLAWSGAPAHRTRSTVHAGGAAWLLACLGVTWQAWLGGPPVVASLPNLIALAALLIWAAATAVALQRWMAAGAHVPLPRGIAEVPSLQDTSTSIPTSSHPNI